MPHPQKIKLMAMQKGKCAYCGLPISLTGEFNAKATVDHVVPKSVFKKLIPNEDLRMRVQNNLANLVVCCERCNSIKADKPLALFLRCRDRNIKNEPEV